MYYFNLKSVFEMFNTYEDKHLNTRTVLPPEGGMNASFETF
jgi:hypothetical protein